MTEFKSYHFYLGEVCPDVQEVYDFLHLADEVKEHPGRIFIDNILPQLHNNTDITGGYIIHEVRNIILQPGIIQIGDIALEAGSQICGYLKKASQVAIFLCTAGEYFTELTNHFNSKNEYLEGYIIDAIGSLTVEKAMDKIQENLGVEMQEKGLKISNRYSPGYCNWALSTQPKLFELAGENTVPIKLTESCLMNPIKSVSGIIGIGPDIEKKEYGCRICKRTDCVYRKIKQNIAS